MQIKTMIAVAALCAGAACIKRIDIADQGALALPTFSGKELLRREEITVRAYYFSKDKAHVELKADCTITGPHGRTSVKSPQKVLLPVYAGPVPPYEVTCTAVIGASERTAKTHLRAKEPVAPATAQNGPSYDPRGGVIFRVE